MKYFKSLIYLLSLCFLNTYGQSISGKVVAIVDGDTFKLLTKDSTLINVRLANIDCPESKQPYSQKAKQFVSDAIFGKVITIKEVKKDRYKRSISYVIYNDNLNLSKELLKQGFAWHYKKYSKDPDLQSLENQARLKKVGLWQDPHAIPPWEWRANKKKVNKPQ